MADKYTKIVFTIIAIALCVIAVQLLRGSSFSNGPTWGDFIALRNIQDPEERKAAHLRLVKGLPLVRVQGGQIDAEVSGEVRIDN